MGLGMYLVVRVFLSTQEALCCKLSSAHTKQVMAAYSWNTSICQGETERSEVTDHLCLHNKFKSRINYVKPCFPTSKIVQSNANC